MQLKRGKCVLVLLSGSETFQASIFLQEENKMSQHEIAVQEVVPGSPIADNETQTDATETAPAEAALPEGEVPEGEVPEGEVLEGVVAEEGGEPGAEGTEEDPAESEVEVEPERVYGGLEGADSMYITIVSSDVHEFVIRRELAVVSGTIRQMLISPGPSKSEEERNIIKLTIPSHLVERICSYLIYREFFTKAEISVEDFDFVVEPYLAFPLLMAANSLTC